MENLTSDTELMVRFCVFWLGGKIFSGQFLDLNLSQQDLQKIENWSTDEVLMTEVHFE